jgi:hypothetical protein
MAEQPNPVMVAVGWLVTVLGGLWTTLAGACTLFFTLGELTGQDATFQLGLLPLFFGLVGIVPGVLILLGGLAILRGQRKRD